MNENLKQERGSQGPYCCFLLSTDGTAGAHTMP